MNRPHSSFVRSFVFAFLTLSGCGRDPLEIGGFQGGNTTGGGNQPGTGRDGSAVMPGSGGSAPGGTGGSGAIGGGGLGLGRGGAPGIGGMVGVGGVGGIPVGAGGSVILPPPDARPATDMVSPVATGLVIRPQNAFVPVGTKVQFNAFLQISPTEFQDVTNSVMWSVLPANGNSIQNGILVADKSGAVAVIAQTTQGALFRAAAMATVVDARITSISITPPNPTIDVGQRQQLSALAAYSDGTQRIVTEQATWNQSMTGGIATVGSTPGTRGLVTGVMPGKGIIVASFAGTTGSTTLLVQAPSGIPVQIVVSPQGSARMVGDIVVFEAVAQFPGGATTNISNQAMFVSSNPTVAQSLGGNRIRCAAAGTVTIAVTYMNVIGRAELRCGDVMAKTTKDLLLTPENASLPVGQPLRVLLDAVFTDGTTMRVQFGATWKSSNDMIATVDATGVVRAIRMGMTTIAVTYGGVTKMINITVL